MQRSESSRRRFLQAAAASAAACGRWDQLLASGCESKSARLGELDGYVKAAMAKWEVPGLAIAVVEKGTVVHARGYGIRCVGGSAKVDPETVFGIASCTKAFTAAGVAKLIDDDKVQWDDPIEKHLPSFQLGDAERTSKITIRHALCHRTGLPTANMLWRSGAFTGDEIVARLRLLEPMAAPGERFLYNNNLYLVIGKLMERLSGRTWGDFLRKELFQPLGMTSTHADSSGGKTRENVAAPHAVDSGKIQRIERYCPDVIAPAGAIHSNVLDMAQWLKLHLEAGRSDGKPVLSKARLAEMHAPPPDTEAKTPADSKVPRAPISLYGLGWFFNEHAGRRLIEHSGVQNGFVSWVAMMPAERVGLVVLSNCHQTGLNSALRSWIFDACLGLPSRDWSETVRADYSNGYQRLLREAKTKFETNRLQATRPSKSLTGYEGVYESKVYGPLRIKTGDKRLTLQFGTRFEGDLQHWENDAFQATFPDQRLDDWLVSFTVKDGIVTGLRVKESPWAPGWYDDADDLGEFLRT